MADSSDLQTDVVLSWPRSGYVHRTMVGGFCTHGQAMRLPCQHARWRSPQLRPTAQCVRIRTATGSPSPSLRYDLQCPGLSGTPSVLESVSYAHWFAGERAVASSGISELDGAETGTELPSTVIHLAKVRRARRRFIRLIFTARLSLGGRTARLFLGLMAAGALSSSLCYNLLRLPAAETPHLAHSTGRLRMPRPATIYDAHGRCAYRPSHQV